MIRVQKAHFVPILGICRDHFEVNNVAWIIFFLDKIEKFSKKILGFDFKLKLHSSLQKQIWFFSG